MPVPLRQAGEHAVFLLYHAQKAAVLHDQRRLEAELALQDGLVNRGHLARLFHARHDPVHDVARHQAHEQEDDGADEEHRRNHQQ